MPQVVPAFSNQEECQSKTIPDLDGLLFHCLTITLRIFGKGRDNFHLSATLLSGFGSLWTFLFPKQK